MLNKIILTLSLLMLTGIAEARIGSRNLDGDQRGKRICVPGLPIASGSDVTKNVNGVVWASTSTLSANFDIAESAIGTIPHPALLFVDLIDGSANDTLTLASIVIHGIDQFGNNIQETLTTITESGATTTKVFSKVTRIVATTWADQTDATDYIQVTMSAKLGLTVHINSYQDVESACLVDASDSNNVKCAHVNDATAYDLQSAVSATNHTIDFSNAMFGATSSKVAVADGDSVCFVVRPNL